MIGLRRLPIRVRVTLAFAVAMALPLTAIAVVLYLRIGHALLQEIDSGLGARAEVLRSNVVNELSLTTHPRSLIEPKEAFEQVIEVDGTILESSEDVNGPLLATRILQNLKGPAFIERRGKGNDETVRMLAVPVERHTDRLVVIVGQSMQDRSDTLRELTAFFAGGSPLMLLLASLAGWIVSGRALRPVERIRREVSAISVSELDHRLTAPPANDEIRRLAETLNEMLARLETATERERRFLDDASHELRTPLTALKAELDLTRSRPRRPDELAEALESASEETDRLVRMAEDLLVLSRAHAGRLPVHPDQTSLRDLVTSASKLFHARAASLGVSIDVAVPDLIVVIDRSRVRQAIDNLLDNAVRHSPRGGAIRVHAGAENGVLRIVVEDDGPGFPSGFERRAFEPFQRGAKRSDGAGLGLSIVKAIAESHGGSAFADNRPEGGARLVLTVKHVGGGGAASRP